LNLPDRSASVNWMIIFDKFGEGQAERNRSVPVFRDNPMRTVIPVSLLRLLALTKEGTKERTKERHSSRLNERLSRSALVAPSATLTSGRIAVSPRGTRVVGHEPRTPISNRELDLLERHLSHCKQRKATVSNRELSTNHGSCNFQIPAVRSSYSFTLTNEGPLARPDEGRATSHCAPFLTGSASQTEFDVTHSKQTTGEFLTGARTAIKVAQFRPEFEPKSQAQREKECRSRDAAEQSKIPLTIRNEKELS
jgi:hypothetical protein